VALDSMLLFKNFAQDPASAKALAPLISKSLRVSHQFLSNLDLQLSEQQRVPDYEGIGGLKPYQGEDRCHR